MLIHLDTQNNHSLNQIFVSTVYLLKLKYRGCHNYFSPFHTH